MHLGARPCVLCRTPVQRYIRIFAQQASPEGLFSDPLYYGLSEQEQLASISSAWQKIDQERLASQQRSQALEEYCLRQTHEMDTLLQEALEAARLACNLTRNEVSFLRTETTRAFAQLECETARRLDAEARVMAEEAARYKLEAELVAEKHKRISAELRCMREREEKQHDQAFFTAKTKMLLHDLVQTEMDTQPLAREVRILAERQVAASRDMLGNIEMPFVASEATARSDQGVIEEVHALEGTPID